MCCTVTSSSQLNVLAKVEVHQVVSSHRMLNLFSKCNQFPEEAAGSSGSLWWSNTPKFNLKSRVPSREAVATISTVFGMTQGSHPQRTSLRVDTLPLDRWPGKWRKLNNLLCDCNTEKKIYMKVVFLFCLFDNKLLISVFLWTRDVQKDFIGK